MFARLIVAGAVVCGLIASEAVAFADPASARMLKGRTAQGYPIKIAVKDGAFRIHGFKADLKCRDGSRLQLDEGGFLWTKTKRNGSFRDAQFGKTDSVYFRGRLSGRRIQGRLRLTDKEKRSPRCASRWIRFDATPR
jgi:hypothetical protein